MSKKQKFVSPGISTKEGMETYFPNLTSQFSDIINLKNQFPNDQEFGRAMRTYLNNFEKL